MTSATWQRRSGLVTSVAGQSDRARGFLDGALVVAMVEFEPEAPDAVTVTVATDADGRVAVVSADHGSIVAGPPLAELAEALAQACEAQVSFDDIVAGEGAENGIEDPRDPFDPEIDVVSAYVPDRSVVYTRAPATELAELAAAVGMPILAAPHLDGHLLLITDGPALSAVQWPEASKPALVIEEGAAYPAVAVVDGDAAHLHTWDADHAVVPSDPALAETVAAFVDSTLGTGALVGQVMALLPSVEPTAVRAAIEGPGAGPAALVSALGLPVELTGFLGHGAGVPDLPGARLQQPAGVGHAFARAVSDAVTDASTQMTESVREQTELMRERAETVRVRAEAARVRAESAFDAAEAFTEEVVVPIRESWWTPAVASVEATTGALLLYRAGRGARAGSGTSAGERALGLVGALLLVDAVVNTIVFLAPRFKRDL